MIFTYEYDPWHIHTVISYSVRLRVARSTVMGKCQSPEKRNERLIQTLTLFLYTNPDEESPKVQ